MPNHALFIQNPAFLQICRNRHVYCRVFVYMAEKKSAVTCTRWHGHRRSAGAFSTIFHHPCRSYEAKIYRSTSAATYFLPVHPINRVIHAKLIGTPEMLDTKIMVNTGDAWTYTYFIGISIFYWSTHYVDWWLRWRFNQVLFNPSFSS